MYVRLRVSEKSQRPSELCGVVLPVVRDYTFEALVLGVLEILVAVLCLSWGSRYMLKDLLTERLDTG